MSCQTCKGTGYISTDSDCSECDGTGVWVCEHCKEFGYDEDCPVCNGCKTGKCPSCGEDCPDC